mmetsp:Transcript_2933/g.3968  ORF Transcript_2933/g.3968 Transcript_2933/m.3968 type:complete len:731 (+) Transcript_2933:188-2380(+)
MALVREEQDYQCLRDLARSRLLKEVIRKCSKDTQKEGKAASSKYLVLILDTRATRILNSVLRMYDITSEGCSVAEPLERNRRPFPDLDAIYIIEPTLKAAERLCKDFTSKNKALYAGVHIFFLSKVGKNVLNVIKSCKVLVHRIKTLMELNLDFLAVEMSTFHLDMPESFVQLYGEGNKASRTACKEAIVTRLVTLCATLNEYPYIRYNSTNPLSTELAREFQDSMNDFVNYNNEFEWRGEKDASQRGTVLLLDRSEDPKIPLLHSFTYQAIINDLLDVQDDILRFVDDSGEDKRCLLSESDDFWLELRHRHMGDIPKIMKHFADDIQVMDPRARLKDDKGEVSVEGLINAVHALPEFGELKEKHLNHLNISAQCMQKLQNLSLLECANVEQTLVNSGVDKDGKKLSTSALTLELMNLVKNPDVGVEETARLLSLYVITQNGIREDDRRRILAAANPPLPLKSQNAIINLSFLGVPIGKENTKVDKALEKKMIEDAKLLATECRFSDSRYKSLISRLVEDMINHRLPNDKYRYIIDPPPMSSFHSKLADSASSLRKDTASSLRNENSSMRSVVSLRSRGLGAKNSGSLNGKMNKIGSSVEFLRARKKTGARIIVFVAGGITHAEIQSIYDMMKDTENEIVVGSTHLLKPKQYLFDLEHLDESSRLRYDDDVSSLKEKVKKLHSEIDKKIGGDDLVEDDKSRPVNAPESPVPDKIKPEEERKRSGICGCFP